MSKTGVSNLFEARANGRDYYYVVRATL